MALRRLVAPILALVLGIPMLTAGPVRAAVCDPGRADDAVSRHIGTYISASPGNTYTGIQSWIEINTVFVDEPPTESWIALYPDAGRLGVARMGLRYNGGNATLRVFGLIINAQGETELTKSTEINAAVPHHFRVQWVYEDTGPAGVLRAGYRLYLDGGSTPWAEHTEVAGAALPPSGAPDGSWWPPHRAYAMGTTNSRGSQILGSSNDKTDWTTLQYARNWTWFAWPAAPAFRNDFGADGSVAVPAAGQMTIYDKDC